MAHRSKFSKRKCKSCIYHSYMAGSYLNIICTYSTRNDTEQTCLYRDSSGKLQDRRGEDYHNCLLYEEGKPVRDTGRFKI